MASHSSNNDLSLLQNTPALTTDQVLLAGSDSNVSERERTLLNLLSKAQAQISNLQSTIQSLMELNLRYAERLQNAMLSDSPRKKSRTDQRSSFDSASGAVASAQYNTHHSVPSASTDFSPVSSPRTNQSQVLAMTQRHQQQAVPTVQPHSAQGLQPAASSQAGGGALIQNNRSNRAYPATQPEPQTAAPISQQGLSYPPQQQQRQQHDGQSGPINALAIRSAPITTPGASVPLNASLASRTAAVVAAVTAATSPASQPQQPALGITTPGQPMASEGILANTAAADFRAIASAPHQPQPQPQPQLQLAGPQTSPSRFASPQNRQQQPTPATFPADAASGQASKRQKQQRQQRALKQRPHPQASSTGAADEARTQPRDGADSTARASQSPTGGPQVGDPEGIPSIGKFESIRALYEYRRKSSEYDEAHGQQWREKMDSRRRQNWSRISAVYNRVNQIRDEDPDKNLGVAIEATTREMLESNMTLTRYSQTIRKKLNEEKRASAKQTQAGTAEPGSSPAGQKQRLQQMLAQTQAQALAPQQQHGFHRGIYAQQVPQGQAASDSGAQLQYRIQHQATTPRQHQTSPTLVSQRQQQQHQFKASGIANAIDQTR